MDDPKPAEQGRVHVVTPECQLPPLLLAQLVWQRQLGWKVVQMERGRLPLRRFFEVLGVPAL